MRGSCKPTPSYSLYRPLPRPYPATASIINSWTPAGGQRPIEHHQQLALVSVPTAGTSPIMNAFVLLKESREHSLSDEREPWSPYNVMREENCVCTCLREYTSALLWIRVARTFPPHTRSTQRHITTMPQQHKDSTIICITCVNVLTIFKSNIKQTLKPRNMFNDFY